MPRSRSVISAVPRGSAELNRIRMLRHRNVHNFFSAVDAVYRLFRKRPAEFHPREAVILPILSRPLGVLDRKILHHFIRQILRQLAGVSDNHRLAVPLIPELGKSRIFVVQAFALINILIDMFHRRAGVCIGIKRKLRNIHAHFQIFIPDFYNVFHSRIICNRVRRVKDNKINPGVCKHLQMLSHYPFVGGPIIPEQRFAPEMVRSYGAAAGFEPVTLGFDRIRRGFYNRTVVIRPSGAVLSHP